MKKQKIFFYSHDTFGLGHIRRTQKIANALAGPDRSMLIACASPKASSYASKPGIDYLNLPGFTKQSSGEYLPRSLQVPIDEFTNLRSQLLLSAVRSFQPDLVFIDKEPLGVKRELYPALEFFRTHLKTTHVVCGFRDILDEREAVEEEWRRRDTPRALRKFFDSIFVYGEREIFDFQRQYGLPEDLARKLVYTGYIHPDSFLDQEGGDFKFADEQKPLITLTLGGGGDGQDILKIFVQYLERSPLASEHNTVLLTGPFMEAAWFQDSKALAKWADRVQIRDFVSNPSPLFAKSRLVLSMGGYNTMCELASMRKRPLILPRVVPRQEQLIRAEAFHARDLCDYIHPKDLTIESLEAAIRSRLSHTPLIGEFPARGLQSIVRFADALRNA